MNGIFHVKSRKGGQTLTPPYAGKTGCGKPNAKTTGNAPDENRTRIGCTPGKRRRNTGQRPAKRRNESEKIPRHIKSQLKMNYEQTH
jgi:hypothetical protein